MSKPLVIGCIVSLLLMASSVHASDVTPPPAVMPSGTSALLASGQVFEPHIGGSAITYRGLVTTDSWNEYNIHYYDLATNADVTLPPPPTGQWRDYRSDVSGNTIVFIRRFSGQANGVICIYDRTTGSMTELDPPADPSHPEHVPSWPRVGGRTVAFLDYSAASEHYGIAVYDLVTHVTTRLTNDESVGSAPSVSPDGSVVVWAKAIGYQESQLWQATRDTDGTWTTKQLTTSVDPRAYPDTNGQVIMYVTPSATDNVLSDIWIQPVGGGPETRIVFPGVKWDYALSGQLIVFSNAVTISDTSDIYAYDYRSNTMYQITDSGAMDDVQPDVSVDADGMARIVWPEILPTLQANIRAYTFQLPHEYSLDPLFNQDHSYKAGGVVPIKVRVKNADGNNVSAPNLLVSASDVLRIGSETPSGVVEAGNASADTNFRYDATLGGYVFNLSSKNLAPGTWELHVMIGADTFQYTVRFSLR